MLTPDPRDTPLPTPPVCGIAAGVPTIPPHNVSSGSTVPLSRSKNSFPRLSRVVEQAAPLHPQSNGWTTSLPIHPAPHVWRVPSSEGEHVRTPGSTNRHARSAFVPPFPLGPQNKSRTQSVSQREGARARLLHETGARCHCNQVLCRGALATACSPLKTAKMGGVLTGTLPPPPPPGPPREAMPTYWATGCLPVGPFSLVLSPQFNVLRGCRERTARAAQLFACWAGLRICGTTW